MTRPIRVPDFAHELRQSAWLAGFIDGEGSLGISRAPNGNCWPTLQVTQRDDDRQLMLAIADALGGATQVIAARVGSGRDGDNPCLHVKVSSKASLMGAVAYLDAYPLRTKKAAEYVVWRGAVITYVNHGGRSPMLVEAKDQLESLRVYKEATMPERESGTDIFLQLLFQGP
jgi:hypothetical protein